MQFSQEFDKIASAFVKAQGKFKQAAKDSENPFYKSKYADLAADFKACQEGLREFELAVIHDSVVTYHMQDKNYVADVKIELTLLHISGQFLKASPFNLLSMDATPQGVKSAITYGRRTTLESLLGIASDDEDGNKSSAREQIQEQPTTPPQEKKERRKLRSELNQKLLKCKTKDQFNNAVKSMGENFKWDALTWHNPKETFRSLANEHLARIKSPNGEETKIQKDFDELLEVVEDKEGFSELEQQMITHPILQSKKNQNKINAIGSRLGVEGY